MILALLEDHEGTLWAGGANIAHATPKLWSIRNGKVQSRGDDRLRKGVAALQEDPRHNLWLLSDRALWRWSPGGPEQFPLLRQANAVFAGDGGEILLAASGALKQLVGGRIKNYRLPGVTGQFTSNSFLSSRDGSLWIGSHQGLWRLQHGRVSRFAAADGLSGDFVTTIFQDQEGDVWVGTSGGLDRFREFEVPTVSVKQGISGLPLAVQATADGSIWMATTNGLSRWQNGRATFYKAQNATGRDAIAELTVSGTSTQLASSGLRTPLALGQDDQGRLWVSTLSGVYCFENGRFVQVTGIPGGEFFGITGDGQAGVWILNSRVGLFRWSSAGDVQQIPWNRFKQKAPMSLEADRVHGGVWVGFLDGGVAHFRDGQVRASYNVADGLGSGRVTQLRFGTRGALWAATEGGLSRIKDGRVATLTSKNGLPCNSVHWSMEDDDHEVWLYTPCGLVRVARSELDAWVNDPNRKLQAFVLDNSDGVPSAAVANGYGPRVTKSPDGRVWFTQREGSASSIGITFTRTSCRLRCTLSKSPPMTSRSTRRMGCGCRRASTICRSITRR